MGARSKTSSFFVLHGLVCTHPSTAANLPCLPGSADFLCVLTSLVPPVHNQGVSSAPNQGHMPYGDYFYRLLAHSLYVLLLTFFFPATAPSGGRFPVTFHFFVLSSYHGWFQPFNPHFSKAQTGHDTLCLLLLMLLAAVQALQCLCASSLYHNPLLL